MISNKDKRTLFYAAGALSLILVYFLSAAPAKEEREALELQQTELEEELTRLRSYADMQEQYERETKEMQQEIDAVLAEFPAGITEETTIMYADMLETDTKINIPTISIGNNSVLYSLGQSETVTPENAFTLYGTPVVYTFTVSYADMKEVVNTIRKDEEKRNVETITLSYESGSGMLVGNMTVNMYAVTREGAQYQEPEVPFMSLGTDNIFGTVITGGGDEAGDEAE